MQAPPPPLAAPCDLLTCPQLGESQSRHAHHGRLARRLRLRLRPMVPRIAPGRSPSAHARHARPRGTGTPHPTGTRPPIRTHSPSAGPPLAMGARVTHSSFRAGQPVYGARCPRLPSTRGHPGACISRPSSSGTNCRSSRPGRGRRQRPGGGGACETRPGYPMAIRHTILRSLGQAPGHGQRRRSALSLRQTLGVATSDTASFPRASVTYS